MSSSSEASENNSHSLNDIPEPSDSIKWLIVILLILICAVVCTPLIVYKLFQFRQEKDDIVIMKRHPKLVILLNYVAVLLLLTELPISFINNLSPFNLEIYLNNNLIATSSFLRYGFIYILSCRFWLIFYDLNYSKALQNQQWKHYIDPDLDKNNIIWIKSHHIFGNIKYIGPTFIVIYVSIITITIINNLLYIVNMQYLVFIFYGIPIIFCFTLWWIIPQFIDNFFIRNEMKLILIQMTIFVLLLFITGLFDTWYAKLFTASTNFIFFLIPFTTTCWVLKKLNKFKFNNIKSKHHHQTNNQMRIRSYSISDYPFHQKSSSRHIHSPLYDISDGEDEHCQNNIDYIRNNGQQIMSDNGDNNNDDIVDFQDIFSNYFYFESFIKFLCTELSQESLLAILEFRQFKQLVYSEFGPHLEEFDGDSRTIFCCDLIPKSHIVYKSQQNLKKSIVSIPLHEIESVEPLKEHSTEIHNIDNMKIFKYVGYMRIICLLYDKYVEATIEEKLQINIAATLKAKYTESISEYKRLSKSNEINDVLYEEIMAINIGEIYCYYDELISEMQWLMIDPFYRFTHPETSNDRE